MGRPGIRHRDAKTYAHDGLDLSLSEWAALTGHPEALLRSRIREGWGIARALGEAVYPTQPTGPAQPEYRVWFYMRERLCEPWRDSFDSFLAALGTIPSPSHIVGRLDIAGAYGPGNCRWMTALEVHHNEVGNTLLTYDGKRQGLGSWAADTGLPFELLLRRVERHMPTVEALTMPLGARSLRTPEEIEERRQFRNLWHQMLYRCHDPENESYESYGGRGIVVCERWRQSFDAFLEDVGARPSPEHTLDRYPDNDGNYEPGNVRWATSKEQHRNMRSNLPLTFRGVTRTLAEWAEISGLPYRALQKRATVLHWPDERTLTEPVRGVMSKLK